MINVTKTFLPPLEEYINYLRGIWERCQLTNHGPLAKELEEKLKAYFGVKHCFFMSSGTMSLQIAIKALDLHGEIITTPFSYVATTSSITWENIEPVFVDICEKSFTIDVNGIESAITPKTTAILATHLYGIPCDVTTIHDVAKKHNLKVIYDAAHAIGVRNKNKSLVSYGDISVLSFHATKLFHTAEGGALITNDDELAHRVSYMKNFGHKGQEDFWGIGINGKNSEFHAALGLCTLPYLEEIIVRRKKCTELYFDQLLDVKHILHFPVIPPETEYNFAYFPVVFESEQQMLEIRTILNSNNIYPRRYFYPPLNKLPYIGNQASMPVTESIASRVLCLPLSHELAGETVKYICEIIKDQVLK